MRLPRVTLVRRLPAYSASVYRAWTDAGQLARWWGGPGASHVVAQCKPSLKGSFLVSGRRADGSGFEEWGRYTVVLPGDVLEFSWKSDDPLPCYVVMQLLDVFGGTELTLVHFGLPDEASCERQRRHWTDALDCLEQLLTA